MKIETQNAATLREAKRTVAEFERTYALSTKEMLMCSATDPRIAQIDGFELMDWHYALEQINALDNVGEADMVHTFHAAASFCDPFRYAERPRRDLVNSDEPELLLVA